MHLCCCGYNDFVVETQQNFEKGAYSMLKKALAVMGVLVFVMVSSLGFAAEKKWYVLKDKNNVCSVRQVAKPTNPVAGPFDKKADAQKAKTEKCPKKAKS